MGLFERAKFRRFIALRIGEGVSRKTWNFNANERRALPLANIFHSRTNILFGIFGLVAFAFEELKIGKRGEIFCDIPSRRLQIAGDGNAKAVVFDKEKHRKFQRRRDIQRSPKAIRCRGGIATQAYRDRTAIAIIL